MLPMISATWTIVSYASDNQKSKEYKLHTLKTEDNCTPIVFMPVSVNLQAAMLVNARYNNSQRIMVDNHHPRPEGEAWLSHNSYCYNATMHQLIYIPMLINQWFPSVLD